MQCGRMGWRHGPWSQLQGEATGRIVLQNRRQGTAIRSAGPAGSADGDRTSTEVRGPPGRDAEPEPARPHALRRHAHRISCAADTSPSPPHDGHHSDHTSPRPPHRGHVRRSGTCSGTSAPQNASCGLMMISADSVASGGPPKNESRIRSSTFATDGKSIATSSASQSARVPDRRPRRTSGAAPHRAALRSPSNLEKTPSRDRRPKYRVGTGVPAAGTRA